MPDSAPDDRISESRGHQAMHLMQAFGIRPVVLMRNLFDAIFSHSDFLDGGARRKKI